MIPMSRVRLDLFDSSSGLDRGASKAKEGIWYIVKLVFFLSALPYPSKLKAYLLRLFGAKIGKNVVIKPRVNIHLPWKLSIGNDVWLGEEVFILNFEMISIGNNVCVSQRAFLCGGNHDFRQPSMPYRNGPITLNDGCWIGAGCFVGPNVTVGEDTIATVNSVVTSNLDPNSIYRSNQLVKAGPRWK